MARDTRATLAGVHRSLLACALLVTLGCGHDAAATPPHRAYRVLVFTKCVVFCHPSIPAGAQAIRELGEQGDFDVDVTDDAEVMSDDRLDPYAAAVFLSTTVENDVEAPFHPGPNPNRDAFIMTAAQMGAFERYIRRGRGYVGIHAASDGDYRWDFYVGLVGAMFKDHATQDPTRNKPGDAAFPDACTAQSPPMGRPASTNCAPTIVGSTTSYMNPCGRCGLPDDFYACQTDGPPAGIGGCTEVAAGRTASADGAARNRSARRSQAHRANAPPRRRR